MQMYIIYMKIQSITFNLYWDICGPFGGLNQNAAAQRCNGGTIYFHVRKTCGHEI